MYELKKYTSINDTRLKESWIELQTGKDMTAFQAYEWYEMLEKEYNTNKLKKLGSYIIYLELIKDGKAVMIAPFHVQWISLSIGNFGYKKNVYFLGMKGYSDYLNFIYKTLTVEDIKQFFRLAHNYVRNKKYILTNIPEDSISSKLLNQLNSTKIGEESCVKVYFHDSYETYRETLSKNLRSSIRRQKNKYIREGVELNYSLFEGVIEDENLIKHIDEIHSARFEAKNQDNKSVRISNMIAKVKKPFDEIQYSLRHNYRSWVLVGKDKEKIIAYFYGLKDDYAVRIMQLGFDPDYYKLMPGNMLLMKYIDENYDELKGNIIDFTRGVERYKYEFGGITHKIIHYQVEL